MKLLDRLARRFGYVKQGMAKRSVYAAGTPNRLTADWTTTVNSADSEIRFTLRILRARARALAANNDYARKFLNMLVSNVVGPKGIRLQCEARKPDGTLDTADNRYIETAWAAWGKKETCSVEGTLTWMDVQRLVLRSIARDGEVLVRRVRGFANEWQYALQVIEADYLDENYNLDLGNGNVIRMGVELDSWKRPVAYHLWRHHPRDLTFMPLVSQMRIRVPAREITHLFDPERAEQTRGIPWMYSAMTRLNMIGGYEEAELVAARTSASKMGFLEEAETSGEEYVGDDQADNGDVIQDVEPGVIEKLPRGYKFSAFDPQHPGGNFAPFMKAMLRGIASGLGVSYVSLATDLEGVNYSSIRQGVLEERDAWRILQNWFFQQFHADVYTDWLEMAILSGKLNLPMAKFDKFNAAAWRPRGWTWVDPRNEMQANSASILEGLTSRTRIAAEQGDEIEEIFDELAEEKKMAEEKGLVFGGVVPLKATEADPNSAGGGQQVN